MSVVKIATFFSIFYFILFVSSDLLLTRYFDPSCSIPSSTRIFASSCSLDQPFVIHCNVNYSIVVEAFACPITFESWVRNPYMSATGIIGPTIFSFALETCVLGQDGYYWKYTCTPFTLGSIVIPQGMLSVAGAPAVVVESFTDQFCTQKLSSSFTFARYLCEMFEEGSRIDVSFTIKSTYSIAVNRIVYPNSTSCEGVSFTNSSIIDFEQSCVPVDPENKMWQRPFVNYAPEFL